MGLAKRLPPEFALKSELLSGRARALTKLGAPHIEILEQRNVSVVTTIIPRIDTSEITKKLGLCATCRLSVSSLLQSGLRQSRKSNGNGDGGV